MRQRAEATHGADFLGIAATGRRVSWEVVAMVKVQGVRVVENCTILDLWSIYKQLGAPISQQ